MKGVYLCSGLHRIKNINLDYNDVVYSQGINLLCSCEDVIIEPYDFVIMTPPCNYYSKANYRREVSDYSQRTKHLLLYCLQLGKWCDEHGKPFIIEMVANKSLLPLSDFYEFTFGGHHFYTNVFFQKPHKSLAVYPIKKNQTYGNRDLNENVDLVIRLFLLAIKAGDFTVLFPG